MYVDIEFSERMKLGFENVGLQNPRYDTTLFREYCVGIVANLRQTYVI